MYALFTYPSRVKNFAAFLFFFWLVTGVNAQSTVDGNAMPAPQLQSIIPASPNAAALGKFGALPVGYYTGVPQISVPLYEINTGKIKLPISLSYHAGGIKVEEIASWVGLGWALNAGGVVTRQTRGRPDEATYGFLERAADVGRYLNGQMSAVEKDAYQHDAISGDVDTQPDLFFYNTPLGSGSFFFNANGSITSIPVSRVNITGSGNAWSVVDVDGTTYLFEDAEQTETTSNNSVSSMEHGYLGPTYTSVFLTRIISADLSEEVRFYYDNTTYSFDALGSQTRYVNASPFSECPAMDPSSSSVSNTIHGKRLKRITFNGGEILFNAASDNRLDLPDDKALDNVVIHNDDNSFYKKIKFYYRYEVSPDLHNLNNIGTEELYRLFLDSVTTEDISAQKTERYAFGYHPGQFPRRTSYDQDYWGYYNAGLNGTNFVPTTYLPTPSGTLSFSGANRTTNPNFAKIGTLNKVTYPTGGSTNFEYESNIVATYEGGSIYNPEENGYVSLGSTLNSTTFTATFTIDAFSGDAGETVPVTAIVNNSGCGGSNQTLGCPLINITSQTSSGYYPLLANGIIQLPPGTYTITADLSDVEDQNVINNFYVTLTWPKAKRTQYNGLWLYERLDGGLRVHKIWDEDGLGHIQNLKTYDYNLPGSTISSGTPLASPDFVSEIRRIHVEQSDDQSQNFICHYKVLSSGSNYPLLSTKGNYVGYTFVKETFGVDGSGGVNEYTFTSPSTHPNINYQDFPYAPSTDFDWRRGLLIHQVTKKKTLTGFEPVQEKFMDYSEGLNQTVKGVKIGFEGIEYVEQGFDIATAWSHLDQERTVNYDQADPNRQQTVIVNYAYSPNALLPNEVVTHDSQSDEVVTKTKYPGDFPAYSGTDNAALGIQKLKERNMIAGPVEVKSFRKVDGVYKIVGGTLTVFDPIISKPTAVWQLIPGSATTTALSDIGTGGFTKDPTYTRRINLLGYSPAYNLLSQSKENDVLHSYVWDYHELYPVAECINASPANVAYTSFEGDGRGGWEGIQINNVIGSSRGITGTKYYQGNEATLTKSGLDNTKKYIVSYWTKNGSPYNVTGTESGYPKTISAITLGTDTWTQYEHLVSGRTLVEISFTGSIDELRLYPSDAQMITCTYTPLAGMTSKCDPSGHINYYDYDDLGRLLRIRDQNDRILKAYEYKYASR